MKPNKLRIDIIVLALSVWLLPSCRARPTEPASVSATIPPTATLAPTQAQDDSGSEDVQALPSPTSVPGLANPASVFCEEHGGRLEIRDAEGGQAGWCVFPDGRECEEWTFFRGECVVQSIYQLPSPDMRGDLVDALSGALGMAVTTAQVPFRDPISGGLGVGWQAQVTGTGLDFESYAAAAQAVRGALESRGWQEDMQYAGGGPTGDLSGYRQANVLCLLVAGWEPAEDAGCPTDQPISACELAPEQQLYTITLTCAQDITAQSASQPEPESTRIQFAPGAISAQTQGGAGSE